MGLTLAGQLDTERLVKAVTDAGLAITGAAFGAFLYKDAAGRAARYVAGVPDGYPELPLGPSAKAFESGLLATVSRSDDLSKDPRHAPGTPFAEMPAGLFPGRSYLAAPVRSRLGALLGGLFLAHPDASFFQERDEGILAFLAAHAAIALDNAHLYREAQEARASAEAANGLKDAFLATLSHELRTPLTAISGWAHLLQRGKLSPEETQRAVETIIRNAGAQAQIIDELLDVSRIITGKLQLDLQPLEIGSVVQAAIVTVTPAANVKGIHIQLIQNPAGTCVMGDPERLQQVFWNLLSNAIKFTPRNGRVRVGVDCVGSSVEVVVTDSGVGIDPLFLPRVFDRFTQDDSSSTRRASGLGLGLSIARQLVELHGGSLGRAESRPRPGLHLHRPFPAIAHRGRTHGLPGLFPGRAHGAARGRAGSDRDPRPGRGRRRRRPGADREGARDPGRHRGRGLLGPGGARSPPRKPVRRAVERHRDARHGRLSTHPGVAPSSVRNRAGRCRPRPSPRTRAPRTGCAPCAPVSSYTWRSRFSRPNW